MNFGIEAALTGSLFSFTPSMWFSAFVVVLLPFCHYDSKTLRFLKLFSLWSLCNFVALWPHPFFAIKN